MQMVRKDRVSTLIFKEKSLAPFYSVWHSVQEAVSCLKDLCGSKVSTTCVNVDEKYVIKNQSFLLGI